MRSQRMLFVAVFLAVICAYDQIAIAQSVYGNIKGTLTDISGKPIAGARVTISSVGKGTKYRTVTDGSGFYAVNNVSPDDYSLRIEADGFKTYQNPLVTVYADNPTMVNPKLVKGSASEVVSGSAADVSVLKIDRTDVATILSRRQVADLPLLNQNVSDLGILAPGAIPVKATLPPVQNPQEGVYINVNGQIFSGTAYQLDGTDNRDPIEGLVIINPNQDAISELKITTQNYSSEFGEATAGVVAAQTRSGSNALHGSLFGYRQSGWGQASDAYLSAEINNRTYKKNQFGGSVGGAIIKNRLFYFADYRGTRDTSGATLTLTVPTENVRTSCVGPAGVAQTPDCDLSQYNVTLTEPTNKNLNYGLGNVVVGASNNMLNNAQVSSQMVYLLNLLPPPTMQGNPAAGIPAPITNNYQATGAEPFNSDNSDLRLDYDASQKLNLFARYSYDLFRQDGSPAFPSGGGPGTNPDLFAGHARTANQSGAVSFSYSFGSNLLTDFRFGYLRYHLDMNSPDFGAYPLVNPAAPSNTIYLNSQNSPADIFSSGLPEFQISGLVGFGYSSDLDSCNCPLREHEQQYQFVDNWTKLAGHHAIRWGADFRYIRNLRLSSSSGNSVSRAGQFQFGGEYTGFPLADFLVGLPDFFDRTYSDPTTPAAFNAAEHQKRAFFFGEDTWRVSSRLTINYGLRWEVYFPQSVNADAGGFLLIHNDSLPSLGNTMLNVAGSSGVNQQGNVQNTYKNFGPRVGLAYLLAPGTVIRAGYGRSFDVGYQGALFGIAATQNPPVAASFDIRNGATTNGFALNMNDGTPTPPAVDLSGFTQFQMGSFQTVQDLCELQPVNNSSQYSCLLSNLILPPPNATGSPASGAALYALPARMRVPTVDAWNLTVQHELTPNMYFELAYVGNKGTHVLTDSTPYYNLNATSLNFVQQYTTIKPPGACKQIDSSSYCAQAPAAHIPLAPWDFPVFYFGNNASDNYHSLQAKFNRRFSGGFSVLANYVWSKVLDYDSSYFAVAPKVGYGPASFDRRQSFAMANSWALPIGRGRALLKNISGPADKVLGGWSLNAITSWYGGLPFSPTYKESNCNADLGSDALSTPPCRPNIVGPVSVTGNRNQYFTTTNGTILLASGSPCGLDSSGFPEPGPKTGSWQRPGCGQIGNAGRNSIRGPQFFQSDVALTKEIPITERVNLRFRADAFNVINKVNLGLPNPQVNAPQGAGAITSIAPGAIQRQWEFSARLQF